MEYKGKKDDSLAEEASAVGQRAKGAAKDAFGDLIPDRGAWMEFETRKSDYIILKFNRKRTVPITVFLRALAAVSDAAG